MKVLLIAPGPVDHAVACANGLAAHADVVLAAPARLYGDLQDSLDPRIDLRLVPWPRTRSVRNPLMLARLLGITHRVRPDVIHVLSNTTLWLNAIAPVLRSYAPLVTTVHDVLAHPGDRDTRRLPDWSARLMARQSDHLVVHGLAIRQAAAARLGKPMSRIHVVPHPAITRYADLARTHALVRTAGPAGLRVLMFGRLFAYKGVDDLIRAEAILGDRLAGLSLTIAGRGDDPSRLEALMGQPQRYDIRLGHIADRDVAQLFLDTDIVVLPYVEASQSGVLMIAATFGKPVIVTDVGELGTTVRQCGAGLVVPPRNPPALAQAMLVLGNDPVLREQLAAHARAWADGPIRPDNVGGQLIGLYHRILPESRSPDRSDAPGFGRSH
ncbi:MAG: glycosyltransferase family 4 protein [Paracoccus sp. (in: a-proteobacteria)]